MKIIYDKETDTLSLIFNESQIIESDELRDGIIIDFDIQGHIVAVEILDASQTIKDPTAISYEMVEKSA